MEYKVIGWTDYDEDYFENGILKRNDEKYLAIVKEIRDKGYCIYGSWHQDLSSCVPVLNDKKKYIFTQRGWGQLMADVYNLNGEYAYSQYMFCDDPNMVHKCHLPDNIDISLFPKEDYLFALKEELYLNLKDDKMSFLLLLNDENNQKINKYDRLYFVKENDKRTIEEVIANEYVDDSIIRKDVREKRYYEDYFDCLDDLNSQDYGYNEDIDLGDFSKILENLYTKEKLEKYGLVAIYLS